MAAKKTTSKSASPPKGTVKSALKPAAASKPSKPAKAAAKPVKAAAKPVKAAAKPAKAAAKPAKAAATAKAAPAAKSAVQNKVSVVPAVKKAVPPVVAPVKVTKPAAKAVVAQIKPEPVVKAEVPVAKVAATKPRSSLVTTPAPPAPPRPPFVPPKTVTVPAGGSGAANGNGSHSPAFVQKQRQRLLDLRDELVDSMSGMTRDTIRNAPEGSEASGSGQHQGDAGSDAYDRDFALSVLAKEQDALYEIEQALRRIQAGTYGICEISARKILQTRLEVIPFARLTVECQAQWEKEYGKRRFRPSNEVGFSGGKYVEDEDSETVSLDEDED